MQRNLSEIKKAHLFTKVFFTTDIHGSDLCFRKLINLAKGQVPPDFLILGGDISGKMCVPMIQSDDTYRVPVLNNLLINEQEKEELELRFANKGLYSFICDENTYKIYLFDQDFRDNIARKLQTERVKNWMAIARECLNNSPTKLIINCGNDDPLYLDEQLKAEPSIIFAENNNIRINDELVLVSIGYSNKTPFCCPRELTEDELRSKISNLIRNANWPSDKLIFNFHCPPFDTKLDLAPSLNSTLSQSHGIGGQPKLIHVGSKVIRESILSFQPIASLHGHIHEEDARGIVKLGNTTCINPGSIYWTGNLQGAWLIFNKTKLERVFLTSEIYDMASEARRWPLWKKLVESIPIMGKFIAELFEKPNATKPEKSDALESKISSMAKDQAHKNIPPDCSDKQADKAYD